MGWATASVVPVRGVTLIVGVIGLGFALNALIRPALDAVPRPARGRAATIWGGLAGYTSFVSHAGAPLWQVYAQPLRLSPLIYAGTTTWFFAIGNWVKLIPYAALGQLSPANLANTAAVLMPLSLVGGLGGAAAGADHSPRAVLSADHLGPSGGVAAADLAGAGGLNAAVRHSLRSPYVARRAAPKAQHCCPEVFPMRPAPYRSVLATSPPPMPVRWKRPAALPPTRSSLTWRDAHKWPPDAKAAARDALAQALTQDYGPRARIVRINVLSTAWGADDASACAGLDIDAVLIPKVDGPDDLDRVAALIPDTPLWAMMETPLGMLERRRYRGASAAGERDVVMGTNDLAKDLGTRFRADRLPMMAGLGLCLLAAKAHGVTIVDGVFNAFKDEDGLRAECEQGRDMGFDGKTLIHPAQLAIANAAFAPTEEERQSWPAARSRPLMRQPPQRRGVAARRSASASSRTRDRRHTARQTLDRAQAIAAMAQ